MLQNTSKASMAARSKLFFCEISLRNNLNQPLINDSQNDKYHMGYRALSAVIIRCWRNIYHAIIRILIGDQKMHMHHSLLAHTIYTYLRVHGHLNNFQQWTRRKIILKCCCQWAEDTPYWYLHVYLPAQRKWNHKSLQYAAKCLWILLRRHHFHRPFTKQGS